MEALGEFEPGTVASLLPELSPWAQKRERRKKKEREGREGTRGWRVQRGRPAEPARLGVGARPKSPRLLCGGRLGSNLERGRGDSDLGAGTGA